MKIRRNLSVLTAILELVVVVNGLWAQNLSPVFSVTVRDMQTVAKNISEIAQVSNDVRGSLLTATLQSYLNQDIVKDAVDLKRPFGVFLFPTETEKPDVVLAVPVVDLAKAFKLLPVPFEVKQVNDNTWNIAWKDEAPIWAYSVRDWCFLSPSEKSAADLDVLVADIQKKLNDDAAQWDLGVSLYVNSIPEKDRKDALEKAVKCARKGLRKGERHIGTPLVDFFSGQLDKLALSAEKNAYESPIDKIASGYVWNSVDCVLSSITTVTGDKAKTQIQEFAQTVQDTETSFVNFGTEGSLASFQFNARIEKLADPIFEQLLKMQWEQAKTKIARLYAAEAEDVVNFIEGNGELFKNLHLNPDVEAAGALFADEKDLTVVWAKNVPDGYALEDAFKTTVKWIGEKKAENIAKQTENATRTEDGDLHIFQVTLLLDKPLPKELASIFNGKVNACIIYAPNAVYYAVGTNAVERALECIKNAKKGVAPLWNSRLSAQGAIQAVCQYGDVPKGLEKKLRNVGETEVSTKIVGRDDGIAIVTEFPAAALEILYLIDEAKK